MCGIAGIFEYARNEAISREVVHRMNETLRHRGPDDSGIYVDGGIGLGHRRLSIIDLAGGHQPLSNEDGTVWVLLNGEIYNYKELRRNLSGSGHSFRTNTDTEAIAHLYEDYGEDCIQQLRGMFALAVWDSRARTLLLARDRIGKKPLFYSHDSERVVFGSELKALLAVDEVRRDIDSEALSDYFSFGYIPAPKTVYRSVRKVLPGHYIVISPRGKREVRYWDLSFRDVQHRTEDEWCELLREELREATQVRLMSDVPLGAFLSGGLDSSSVVAMMTQLTQDPVITCSVGFEEEEYNEASFARAIAQHFHTSHHEQIVRPRAVDVVDKLVWHYDEPFADSSAVPTYYVSHAARQHVTVALGGDGGDENFAGYRRYYFDCLENRLRRHLPAGVRQGFFAPLGRWYPGLAWAPRPLRAKATLQSLGREPLAGYFNSISIFRPDEKLRLLSNDFRSGLQEYNSLDVLGQYYHRADTDDLLTRVQYVDMKTYLPDDILTKVDRASMAVGLEVRAPLLDHKLMETVAAIPSSLKLKGRVGKYIYRKAVGPLLPETVLRRPKKGFAIPLDRWFRHELRDFAYEAILGNSDGILDRAYVAQLWREHQNRRHDRSAHLWALLMFAKWKERFGPDHLP